MQTNFEVIELFPTPVFTTMLPQKLSTVVPWFFEQEVLGEVVDTANFGDRSKNSYILEEPECKDLNSFILELGSKYGRQLGYDYDEYRFGQSWLSYKHPGQSHSMHSHPNSLISGVFYFGEPTEDTPAIKFHKMIGGINASYIQPKEVLDKSKLKYAQKEFSIKFTPGLLILFPSYLLHSVPLNKSNNIRCSLAFNIVPKIGFGEEGSLTELKF